MFLTNIKVIYLWGINNYIIENNIKSDSIYELCKRIHYIPELVELTIESI